MAAKDGKRRSWATNVVRLSDYRAGRTSESGTLLYVTESGDWLDLLSSRRGLRVTVSPSRQALETCLERAIPDLILIESWISWSDPYHLARSLHEAVGVPIIMTFDGGSQRDQPNAIKAAYASGVSDTLFSPLNREELHETIEVLLKFREQHSLYH